MIETKTMKLKTLKDLKTLHGGYVVSKRKLKQEAIKWVNFIMKDTTKDDEKRVSKLVWIMNFFNITEEDLK